MLNSHSEVALPNFLQLYRQNASENRGSKERVVSVQSENLILGQNK